jgi:hypothetical protein
VLLEHGLQIAYITLAVSYMIILIVVLFIIREHPHHIGLKPFGDNTPKIVTDEFINDVTIPNSKVLIKKYFAQPLFWVAGVSIFIITFTCIGVQNNQIPFFLSRGFDKEFVLFWYATCFLTTGAFRAVIGFSYDKLGYNFTTISFVTIGVISMVFLTFSVTPALMVTANIVFSLIAGIVTLTPTYTLSKIIPKNEYPFVFSMIMVFYATGMAFGPVFISAIYEWTNSFNIAWLICGTLFVIMGVLLMTVYKRGVKNG